MARNNTWIYHLVAFATVAIWGCTFVSTKVLMLNGLSPAQIFTLRFLIAYVMMLAVYHSRLWADSWRDELKMMLLGISGGSLYFLSENEAMNFTSTTNTSLIVCSCPLFATLLVRLVYRSTTRISMMQLGGSLLAFAGMVIVVLNGRFVLHLSPLGDALAFTACLSWSVYSLLMKWVSAKYGAAFITRKVFFYGVLTILPYYIFYPTLPAAVLTKPVVVGNLAFLGCLASMICFLTWNWCISKLGAVKATNWVYFNPITTMIFASWVLGEKITPYFLAGATCILLGMFVADRSTKTNN